MKEDPTRYSVFSYSWFFGAFVMHLIITLALAGIAFVTGMGSFTHDVSFAMGVWKVVLMIWTPLAVASGGSLSLAILWSVFVGIAIGLIAPRFRK